ncbi:MAG: FAD-dependent oxidoreductase, partial [Sphaerochaetaceae bacterium]
VESPEDLIRTETNLDVFSIKPEPWFNNRIAVKSYAYEPSFAPQGKQILQVMWGMDQSSWEYWKELYTNKEAYKAKKQELASLLQKKLEETWPGYKGKLTLLDSWTPCTYHRYCNAHNGYNQACVITKRSAKRPYPSAFVKGIGNLVLAGQWVSPPGGIPGSCITGKHAAYRVDYLNHKGTRICKKIFFQNVLPTLLAVFLILFLKFRA